MGIKRADRTNGEDYREDGEVVTSEAIERPGAQIEEPSSRNGGPGAEREALHELLALHHDDLRRFVNRILPNPEDAADVLQQTFFLACLRWSSFRGENFRAWLYTIARHLVIDHHRARQRLSFADVSEAELWDDEPALQIPYERVRSAFESRERLQHCLDCISRELPVSGQVAVLMSDFYGFTDKESAATVRLTLPSLKKLLHTARTNLRAAALGVCTFVASGDCPLLRAGDLNDSRSERVESVATSEIASNACGAPPPRCQGCERADLATLRRELLDGLGFDPRSGNHKGPSL